MRGCVGVWACAQNMWSATRHACVHCTIVCLRMCAREHAGVDKGRAGRTEMRGRYALGTALQASVEKAKIFSGSRSFRSSKKMPPSPRVSSRCLRAVFARQSFLRGPRLHYRLLTRCPGASAGPQGQ